MFPLNCHPQVKRLYIRIYIQVHVVPLQIYHLMLLANFTAATQPNNKSNSFLIILYAVKSLYMFWKQKKITMLKNILKNLTDPSHTTSNLSTQPDPAPASPGSNQLSLPGPPLHMPSPAYRTIPTLWVCTKMYILHINPVPCAHLTSFSHFQPLDPAWSTHHLFCTKLLCSYHTQN